MLDEVEGAEEASASKGAVSRESADSEAVERRADCTRSSSSK